MVDDKTREKRDAILAAFAEGMTWFEATQRAGVGETTVRRWCASDPEFAAQVDEARSRADDAVEATAYRNCLDPDAAHNTLRMFWLKSRRPEVYGDRSKLEVSGKGGGPVEFLAAVDKVYGVKPE